MCVHVHIAICILCTCIISKLRLHARHALIIHHSKMLHLYIKANEIRHIYPCVLRVPSFRRTCQSLITSLTPVICGYIDASICAFGRIGTQHRTQCTSARVHMRATRPHARAHQQTNAATQTHTQCSLPAGALRAAICTSAGARDSLSITVHRSEHATARGQPEMVMFSG